jgi:hypothetical protein
MANRSVSTKAILLSAFPKRIIIDYIPMVRLAHSKYENKSYNKYASSFQKHLESIRHSKGKNWLIFFFPRWRCEVHMDSLLGETLTPL